MMYHGSLSPVEHVSKKLLTSKREMQKLDTKTLVPGFFLKPGNKPLSFVSSSILQNKSNG